MDTVTIIGANGMLGYAGTAYFQSRGYCTKCLTRDDFDIFRDDLHVLEPHISESDWVINCAGVIRQKMNSYTVEEILKVNGQFPVNLARLCDRYRVKCFHITTDCVYSGKKGSYVESDYYDADDIYGMSKNAGDNDKCMTLRTSIIGEEKSGFKSLLEWTRSQKDGEISGYANHFWNGVTTPYLAEIIDRIIGNGLYERGIFHIYTKDTVSKYELVSMINEVYGLGIKIRKEDTECPYDRSLKSEKSLCDRIVTKDIQTQIREMKSFFETLRAVRLKG
jgi:dTDP-4-dehydrorhamnose reductase